MPVQKSKWHRGKVTDIQVFLFLRKYIVHVWQDYEKAAVESGKENKIVGLEELPRWD